MLRRACFTVLALVLLPATVQAFDHHHHHRDSGSDGGGGCSSSSADESSSPTVSATKMPTPVLTSNHKRVFITSTAFSGAVGGLDAADMYCQSAATDAGLSGTYRAWLSTSSTNASDRIGDVGPWSSTRDNVVFSSKAALREAPSSEMLDEHGAASATPDPWTGTDARGAASGSDCEGWTNGTGAATATTGTGFANDVEWGGGATTLHCDATAPLICFQQ
jgi:hypothetical protein